MNVFWFQLFFSMYPDRDNPWRMLAVSSTDSFCILSHCIIVNARWYFLFYSDFGNKKVVCERPSRLLINRERGGTWCSCVLLFTGGEKNYFDRFLKMCEIHKGLHLALIRVNAAGEDKREVRGSGSNPDRWIYDPYCCVYFNLWVVFKEGGSYCLYYVLKWTEEEHYPVYEITYSYGAFN